MIEETPEEEKKTSTPSSSPNFEWKKKGVGNNEKISLSVDIAKALKHDAKKKSNFKNNDGKKISPKELGLKKILTKIRDVYDDEEDGEYQIVPNFDENNSLLNALTENEKKDLNQKNNSENVKIHDDATKISAINMADKMMKDAGMGGMSSKEANKNMVNSTYVESTMGEALKKDVSKKMNIKSSGSISASKHKDLIQGIKKINEKGGRIEGMKVQDVAEAGNKNTNDKRIAEIIYTSASTKDKKRIHDKTEVKQIITKTGRDNVLSKNNHGKKIEKEAIKEIQEGNVRVMEPERSRGQNMRGQRSR